MRRDVPLENEGDAPLPLDRHVHGLAHQAVHLRIHFIIIMEKDQTKLVIKCEIKKERVSFFPYYIVSTTFSTQEHFFIVAADYSSETAILSVYPFKSDMTKLITTTISLTDILPRKIISTIHVLNLIAKPNNSSVSITQAEFIIGFRSGQLIVVQYKDREAKVKQRYNKSLKSEGFFSKASSAIFGGEQTYNPFFKQPIRSFSLHPQTPDCYYTWQVGNNIILQKQLNESKQNKFFSKYESLDLQNFQFNYDINKVFKQGDLFLYGCEYYTSLSHPEYSMSMIAFNDDISSITHLPSRKQIVVSLISKEVILIIDLKHFALKGVIHTEMPIRKLNSFVHKNQHFLVLMPYENYIVLYSLNSNSYCKFKGHKSFVGNISFNEKNEKIITAGMDHQICMMKLSSINEQSWIPSEKVSQTKWKIKEYGVVDQKFEDIYKLGQEKSRSNLSSYGYADIYILNGLFCLPTYDSRIIIYSL